MPTLHRFGWTPIRLEPDSIPVPRYFLFAEELKVRILVNVVTDFGDVFAMVVFSSEELAESYRKRIRFPGEVVKLAAEILAYEGLLTDPDMASCICVINPTGIPAFELVQEVGLSQLVWASRELLNGKGTGKVVVGTAWMGSWS